MEIDTLAVFLLGKYQLKLLCITIDYLPVCCWFLV